MQLTLNVLYVLVALAIIVLVLMQRGSGAAAGSGFGGGASGTVFGARGASNFLSKSTKWLAIAFFGISLFMAWQASHGSRPEVAQDLGIMSAVPVVPAEDSTGPATSVPAAPIIAAPAGEATTVPQAPATSGTSNVPAAPSTTAPSSAAPATTPQDD